MSTRIVRLDLSAGASPDRRPLGVRIFHRDTVYWIRTRVLPGVSLKGLLHHLLDEIERRRVARLPASLFHYSIFDMTREITVLPDLFVDDVAGPVLYVHESEFLNAFDRRRRVELIARHLKDIEPELDAPPAATARRPTAQAGESVAGQGRAETSAPDARGAWADWQRIVR